MGDRRKAKLPIENILLNLTEDLPVFSFSKKWNGANNSTQYIAEISYASTIPGDKGSIKIELGLREPVLINPSRLEARSLLLKLQEYNDVF